MPAGTIPKITKILGCGVNGNDRFNENDCVFFEQAYNGVFYDFQNILILMLIYLFIVAIGAFCWAWWRKNTVQDKERQAWFKSLSISNEKFCALILKLSEIFKIASILLLMVNWGQFVEFFCQRPEILVLANVPGMDPVGSQLDLNCHSDSFKAYVIYPKLLDFANNSFPFQPQYDGQGYAIDSPTTPPACYLNTSNVSSCAKALNGLYDHMCSSGQTHRPERLVLWYGGHLFFEVIGFFYLVIVLPHHLTVSSLTVHKANCRGLVIKVSNWSWFFNFLIILGIFLFIFLAGIFWLVDLTLMYYKSDQNVYCQADGALNNLTINVVFIFLNTLLASFVLARVISNFAYFENSDRDCNEHCHLHSDTQNKCNCCEAREKIPCSGTPSVGKYQELHDLRPLAQRQETVRLEGGAYSA